MSKQFRLTRSKDTVLRFDVKVPLRLSLDEMTEALMVRLYPELEPVIDAGGDLDRAVAKRVTSQRKAVDIATETLMGRGRDNIWSAADEYDEAETVTAAIRARIETLWA